MPGQYSIRAEAQQDMQGSYTKALLLCQHEQGQLVSADRCRRRTETKASTQPLTTQGKELRGAISTLKSARLVNTTCACHPTV